MKLDDVGMVHGFHDGNLLLEAHHMFPGKAVPAGTVHVKYDGFRLHAPIVTQIFKHDITVY